MEIPTFVRAVRECLELRPEKGTRPRAWFAHSEDRPMEEWEPKIPGEGESYHNDAYSVYQWKKGGAE